MRALLPLVRERLPTLAAITDVVGFLWVDELDVDPAMLVPKRWDAATTATGLAAAGEILAAVHETTWEADELEPPLRELAEARGWKAGDLFMAIRVATTGQVATPPLFDTLVALGREPRRSPRLEAARAKTDRDVNEALTGPARRCVGDGPNDPRRGRRDDPPRDPRRRARARGIPRRPRRGRSRGAAASSAPSTRTSSCST